MRNIDLLPIADEAKKRLSTLALQYRRMGRIYIEIISFDGKRLIVRAEQKELINDKVLTKIELVERVRDMFTGEVPDDWKLTVSAVNFDRRDIAEVNADWLNNNMDRLDLKAKDVVNHTGLDRSSVSSYLSGNKNMTKLAKIAFYYFVKHYEMSNFDK